MLSLGERGDVTISGGIMSDDDYAQIEVSSVSKQEVLHSVPCRYDTK